MSLELEKIKAACTAITYMSSKLDELKTQMDIQANIGCLPKFLIQSHSDLTANIKNTEKVLCEMAEEIGNIMNEYDIVEPEDEEFTKNLFDTMHLE